MELFRNLTDDQLALLGCTAALVLSGTVMALSHFIGRARREARLQNERARAVIKTAVPDDIEVPQKRRRVA